MSLQTPGRNRRRILFAVYGAALLYFVLKQCYYIFCVGGFPDQTAHISYLIYAVKFPFRLPDFRAMTMYQYAGETGGLSLFTPLEGVPDYLGHPPLYYWLMSLLGGVRQVIGYGECGPRIVKDLTDGAGILTDNLPHALEEAVKLAAPGDVVLLSPTTSSYDQYSCFEERGEHFKSLVNDL